MAFLRHRGLALFLIFCLVASSWVVALGEDSFYPFFDEELGIYLPSGWRAVTKNNMAEQGSFINKLGTTVKELEEGFNQQDILAIALSTKGTQFVLKSFIAPENWSFSAFTKGDQKQEEAFEEWVSAQYSQGNSGNWLGDDVFVLQVADEVMPLVTHIYATYLGNRIFIWEVPVFDRSFTDEEEQEVLLALEGLTYLGHKEAESAKNTPAPLATLSPAASGPSPKPAQVKVTRDNTPIDLDYIPSLWESTLLPISGTTEPLAELRYYIGSVGHQRFTADEKGQFSVEVSGLSDGKNTVSLQSVGKNGYGNVSFTLTVDRIPTPLVITPLQGEIAAKTYIITGTTLPGATLQAQGKQKSHETIADEKGHFSIEVALPRMGDNSFTLSSIAQGYRKHNQDVTLHRVEGEEEAIEAFLEKAITPDYEKALENPEINKDKAFDLTGTILRISSYKGQPAFIFKEEEQGQEYYVFADHLIDLLPGNFIRLLATFTGETIDHPLHPAQLLPCAALFRALPFVNEPTSP